MSRPEEVVDVLSIGAVDGGSTDGGLCRNAVQEVGRAVRRHREGVSSPLNVNVVFHIGGRFLMPEFEGVRTGTYRKRDQHLMVQAALLPDEVTDARSEVLRLLAEAVDEAERWARKRRVADSLDSLSALVRRVAEEG